MNFFNFSLFAIIFCVCAICSVWDLKTMKVPDFVIFIGIAAIIFCNLFFSEAGTVFSLSKLMQSVLTGVLTGLFYFIVKIICRGKLGNGDILFGIFQGVCLTPKGVVFCLAIEVLSAAAFVLIKKILCKESASYSSEKKPFVPFMAAGLLISYIVINYIQV